MVETPIGRMLNHKLRSIRMKRTPLALTALAFLLTIVSLPARLHAQKFEGTVEFNISTDEANVPMTYMMKGNNIRVETEGRPGMKAVFLIDVKENKSYMIIDPMKMYMESPEPQSADSNKPAMDIKKTGKTQKLLGYDCEEFLIKDGERETNVWVTKALGAFELYRMGGGRQRSSAEAWQKAIGSKGGFPLLAVTKMSGKQISSLKATKVEKKSLDDSIFKIPEGYQRMDTSMMRRPR
jgi:hypothetical protein